LKEDQNMTLSALFLWRFHANIPSQSCYIT